MRDKYTEGKLTDVADGRIKGEYEVEEMVGVLKLGLSCCHPDPLHRPTMREVVAILLGEEVASAPRVILPEIAHGEKGSTSVDEGESVAFPSQCEYGFYLNL